MCVVQFCELLGRGVEIVFVLHKACFVNCWGGGWTDVCCLKCLEWQWNALWAVQGEQVVTTAGGTHAHARAHTHTHTHIHTHRRRQERAPALPKCWPDHAQARRSGRLTFGLVRVCLRVCVLTLASLYVCIYVCMCVFVCFCIMYKFECEFFGTVKIG